MTAAEGSEAGAVGDGERTFIEAARRAQLVAAAVDTLAAVGYGRASLARIAERAGTSKGVATYHFANKQDLIGEVVADVLARGGAYMRPRVEAETTGMGMLRAYIESNLGFMASHRNHILALREIFANARDDDGCPLYGLDALERMTGDLEARLGHFQATGEFREFDARVMAIAIRAAIDAVPPRLARRADLDLAHHAVELATAFELAVRRPAAADRARGGGRP